MEEVVRVPIKLDSRYVIEPGIKELTIVDNKTIRSGDSYYQLNNASANNLFRLMGYHNSKVVDTLRTLDGDVWTKSLKDVSTETDYMMITKGTDVATTREIVAVTTNVEYYDEVSVLLNNLDKESSGLARISNLESDVLRYTAPGISVVVYLREGRMTYSLLNMDTYLWQVVYDNYFIGTRKSRYMFQTNHDEVTLTLEDIDDMDSDRVLTLGDMSSMFKTLFNVKTLSEESFDEFKEVLTSYGLGSDLIDSYLSPMSSYFKTTERMISDNFSNHYHDLLPINISGGFRSMITLVNYLSVAILNDTYTMISSDQLSSDAEKLSDLVTYVTDMITRISKWNMKWMTSKVSNSYLLDDIKSLLKD